MDGLQAHLDDSGAWPSVGHSPKPPPHCPLSTTEQGALHTLVPSQNNFKTVTMTRMNRWTNSPMSSRAFLHCAVRKALGSAEDLLLPLVLDRKSPNRVGTGGHA